VFIEFPRRCLFYFISVHSFVYWRSFWVIESSCYDSDNITMASYWRLLFLQLSKWYGISVFFFFFFFIIANFLSRVHTTLVCSTCRWLSLFKALVESSMNSPEKTDPILSSRHIDIAIIIMSKCLFCLILLTSRKVWRYQRGVIKTNRSNVRQH
jgi:hypothetical protein